MPWWQRRAGQTDTRTGDAADVPTGGNTTTVDRAAVVATVTLARVAEALDKLDIRYLTDGSGTLLALWERHAVLFALEGPDDEILVIRARPHTTVPPDWAPEIWPRAYVAPPKRSTNRSAIAKT